MYRPQIPALDTLEAVAPAIADRRCRCDPFATAGDYPPTSHHTSSQQHLLATRSVWQHGGRGRTTSITFTNVSSKLRMVEPSCGIARECSASCGGSSLCACVLGIAGRVRLPPLTKEAIPAALHRSLLENPSCLMWLTCGPKHDTGNTRNSNPSAAPR